MTIMEMDERNRTTKARVLTLTQGYDGERHYLALLASIIPALAILAVAVSLLMAAN
ncbi:MAG TPA: hypothetical protein VGM83_20900 [Devosiaceae bacterium]|jgi:hypothetical protein